MQISRKNWQKYIDKLDKINSSAAQAITRYIDKHGLDDVDDLIRYANLVVQQYGNASASLSALMYDMVVDASGLSLPPAEAATLANIGEVAKTINGVLKTSQNKDEIAGAVSRHVKKAGADTTLKNAYRDGGEFAWIPSGDTCAYCLSLASLGWVNISKERAKMGYQYAEHIHSNCNCTYAVRFSERDGVAGYNPEKYQNMINSALEAQDEGSFDDYVGRQMNPEVINAVRRQNYAKNKEQINAQKRDAYEKRQELNSSAAEESNVE